ncbi:MAG TPA: DUF3489 domain-containing protein [Amaricoccus sp.]|uniref:DUF3489 domain-containing protein n=1 Tax=Amaricoccus sp. TaxID=1872485 RepID=UPI002B7C33A8|nr:DUF3489 domain-containing protein [Amaricoccus sp.]HMQ94821.1 DUF3489 domain-containing protein [Amaricoccus sp.]HMR54781.1 DUF3489 domain-containing protein [Amaricoccus sp.]HMU01796.1 DUF3489 domain-containing protein [Amaricoccus sp.]
MPRLSDTQTILLTAAAARPDLRLLPVPDRIRLKGGALERTVKALFDRGFVTDGTGTGPTAQPTTDSNRLVVTPKGLAAIGVEIPDAGPPASGDCRSARRSTDASLRPDRPGGKLGILLDAVARPTGATLDELATATAWLPHTTRAALARLRQRGFDVRLVTTDGRKAYRLVEAA